jgi:hypothetical protein
VWLLSGGGLVAVAQWRPQHGEEEAEAQKASLCSVTAVPLALSFYYWLGAALALPFYWRDWLARLGETWL